MATARVTEQQIRVFCMDRPEQNSLLRGVRWSPEEIEAAQIMVVSYFNESPPSISTSYTVESFPFSYAMLTGCAGHLLKSAAINQASNQLTYQLDGVQVADNDKADIFSRMGQQFWDEFKLMVTATKMQRNVADCFGAMGSEWQHLHR